MAVGNKTQALQKNQRVRIRVDTQEQRSGIPQFLAAMPQQVERLCCKK